MNWWTGGRRNQDGLRWKQIRRLFSKNYNTRITSIYQEFSNTAVSYSGILCKYVPKFVFF